MGKEKQNAGRSYMVGNRIAFAVLLAFIGMTALMFLHNALNGISSVLGASVFVKVLCGISAVLLAGALVLFFIRRRKKVDDSAKLINSTNLLCLAAGLFIASVMLVAKGAAAAQLLLILVPVITAYYLIYYVYQHEFFVLTVFGGVLLAGLHFLRRYMEYISLQKIMPFLIVLAALVLAGITALLAVLMMRTKPVKAGKISVKLSKPFCVSGMILAGAAVLILLGALLFGAAVAQYGFYVLAVLLAGTAIYYTTKLK